jgi:DNA-binding transcriptional LysR family regulator
MELRHLEQIVAVVKAGGFNGAARLLGVAQPTLSKSIARLESQLGLQLFDRSTEGTRPTPHGDYLARRAEPLLHEVAALMREVEQRSRGDLGVLTIAAGAATHLNPLPMVITRSATEFPNLQLVVRRVASEGLARGVHEGAFDISFSRRENAESYPDLVRIKLFDTDTIFVVRPGHPLLARAPVGPADVLAYPMANMLVSDALLEWLGPITPDQNRRLRGLVSDDPDMIRHYPQGTDRIARGPRFVFDRELASGTLIELPSTETFPFECWMLTTKGLWSVPLVRRIAQIAKGAP